MSLSIKLIGAKHGDSVFLPALLPTAENTLQFNSELGTTAGITASGTYKMVTTSDVNQIIGAEDVLIYRAMLEPIPRGNNIAVVVKLAASKDAYQQLVDEGKVYAFLESLVKESRLPVCYGAHAVTNHENEEQTYGCLILQDCGKIVKTSQLRASGSTEHSIGYVDQPI